MKSHLKFKQCLPPILVSVFTGTTFWALLKPSAEAAFQRPAPQVQTLAQAPVPFELEDFDFWADQCLLLSSETDYEKTLESCETAITLRPGDANSAIWFARSQALFSLARYPEAIGSFNQIIERTPNDSISIAYQCASLYQLARLEDAVDTCETALQIDGNWGQESPAIAWYYRGLALQSMGRLETALTSYDQALLITPEDTTVRAGLCALATELGEPNRCSLADAAIAYEQMLATTPNDATLWVQQGLVLEQLGRFAQAATAYESAIALKPNYSLALAHQCAALNELDAFDAALAACDAALQGDGDWDRLGPVFVWSQRSTSQIGLEEYALALASADRAISLNAEYPGGWNNRAVSLWHLDQLPEAEHAIETARVLTKNIQALFTESFSRDYPEPELLFARQSAVIAYNQGTILQSLYLSETASNLNGQYLARAMEAYETARKLQMDWQPMLAAEPSFSYPAVLETLLNDDFLNGQLLDDRLFSSLLTNYATVHLYAGNGGAAVNRAFEATEYNSEPFEVWLNLALAYASNGNYAEAQHAYQVASERDPERLEPSNIGYFLGRAALQNEDYEIAWNYYTASASQAPERADAVVGQGLALQGLISRGASCNAEAVLVFDRALNLDPANAIARQAYDTLTQDTSFVRGAISTTVSENSGCPIQFQ